jgi:phospholipase C
MRPSCALPYELHAEGRLNREASSFEIVFEAANAGAPYQVYAPGGYYPDDAASYTDAPAPLEETRRWSFTVVSRGQLAYSWPLASFEDGRYHLRTYGPNGFYREYTGGVEDPAVEVACRYSGGNLVFQVMNTGSQAVEVTFTDQAYGAKAVTRRLNPGERQTVPVDLAESFRWYDLVVTVAGVNGFSRRYAGRAENGEAGMSDPLIGRNGAAPVQAGQPDLKSRPD